MAHARGKRRCVVLGCDRLEERTVMSASVAGGFVGELPGSPSKSVSTVAANGDQSPYGVVSVPGGFLVTDVGTAAGGSASGTTVEKVFLNGKTKIWYTAPKGFGLTGAITTLPDGEVIVGIGPASGSGGTSNAQDSLVVLNRQGRVIADLKNLNLPAGLLSLAANGHGPTADLFVSDSANETVTRVNLVFERGVPRVTQQTVIASGYPLTTPVAYPGTTVTSGHGVSVVNASGIGSPALLRAFLDPSELGLAFDPKTDVLYVSSTGDQTIYAITAARSRTTAVDKGAALVQNDLYGVPFAVAFAPNGDLLVSNDSGAYSFFTRQVSLAEYTMAGGYVNTATLGPSPSSIPGLVVKPVGHQYWVATVNGVDNTLEIRKVHK